MNKKITINQDFFEKNLPPQSEGFTEATMAMLRAEEARPLSMTESGASLENRAKPTKRTWITGGAKLSERAKPRPRMALLVALLLILLMATALAVGLRLSAQYTASRNAREAVLAKYGLTEDTLATFWPTEKEENGVLTITYEPTKYDMEAIGTYTVSVAPGQEPIVSWSHDGWTAESGTPEPWGQDMLQKALDVERAHGKAQQAGEASGNMADWTLEDWAARDSILAEASEEGLPSFVMHVAPREEDFSEEEAIQKAKSLFIQEYGISPEALAGPPQDVSLLKYVDEEEPVYVIHLGDESQMFYIRMYTPSGEVERIVWETKDPAQRTLPAGDLASYRRAVEDYVKMGSFALLPPAEKAEVAGRILAAGFGEVIENEQYVAPVDGDISEEAARQAARTALRDKYQMDDIGLGMVRESASLVMVDDARVWKMHWKLPEEQVVHALQEFRERVGEYTVLLAAESGDVQSAAWTNDDITIEKLTQSTWGPAPAIPAYALPWAKDFQAGLDTIGTEYPDDMQGMLEWEAATAALYRGIGCSQYTATLPAEGDLTLAEALALAREALRQEYGVEEEIPDNLILPYFREVEPGRAVWCLSFFPDFDGATGDYTVELDAKTGEILSVQMMMVGVG